ncbi:MAG: hypothetical protein BWY56_00480 [Acidobacteria bacterium ADurb.Bin340]|nr:MAG: hypothetical protein BWY56_00480 [Acidobacteria bacterium ADurb.Bin340]
MGLSFANKPASLLFLEPHRIVAGGRVRPLEGLPAPERLAQALAELPQGPTAWVVDDLWAPALLLRDLADLPPGAEARDAFFRWRYAQALGLEDPQSVQTIALGEGAWLAAGLPESLRDAWLTAGARASRPVERIVPRWLWVYNRLAPEQERPGLLLSLCPHPEGGFTGTLAAWGRTLALLRQWAEPATPEQWMAERVAPSAAFLQRESRSPQELRIWGASSWVKSALEVHLLPSDIPTQEGV